MFGDGELPCNGVRVPGMVSAAVNGPAVSVCGRWAKGVSFPGMGALLTSLALNGCQQAVKAAGAAAASVISPVRTCRRASLTSRASAVPGPVAPPSRMWGCAMALPASNITRGFR